jgi:Abnormal spindle-like microcephaly-assoc'd, ASPM-SPD-2-Hydin
MARLRMLLRSFSLSFHFCLLFVALSIISLLFSPGLHAQTVTTFEGIDASQLDTPELDPDPNGAVGTKQYMEWINVYFQAWDKTTHAPVWSVPQQGTSPFVANGNTNCTTFAGDGVVIFDRLASRWVIAAHTSGSTNYYYCVAISNTDDLTSPTLAWFTYAISLNSILGTNSQGNGYFPDWPKIATWPDAYYVGMDIEDINQGFREVGSLACALDRANMLTGATPNPPQCFVTNSPISGDLYLSHSLEPADVEGTTPPPAGAPEYFASIQNPVNDGVTTTSDSFNLWQFHVDWNTPANSTFSQSTVPVDAYTPGCYRVGNTANTICVPEPSTATTHNFIDSVGDRFMFRFAYRNFGTYQSYLASHTVQVGTGIGTQTGVRWYELRGSGTPALSQSGTISPDSSLYRFMPSIAQDQSGNAAVGYSVSSAATHPGISASWWSLPGQTTPTEISLFPGSGDQENTFHWGDYTSMTVDPIDGCTFWYVNEYFTANQTAETIWQTRISNFKLSTCGTPVITLSPTSLTFNSAVVGVASSSQPVTVHNTSTVSANISGVQATGDFSQTNTCGTTLAAGASCTINVVFTATTSGSRTGTVAVSDNASGGSQSTSLTGTGVDFTVSAASSSNTIPAGGTATYSLTVAAAGGTFSNAVSFACTGLPAGATCGFSPATVTPGATSAPVSLTITTAAVAGVVKRPLSAVLMQLPGLGLLGMIFLFSGKRSKRAAMMATLGCVLVAFMVMAACGGSGNSGGNPGGTTYNVTVTASAGTLQHTLPLTLTVQ